MKEDAVWIVWFRIGQKGHWHLDKTCRSEADAFWFVERLDRIYPNNRFKIKKYVAEGK